MVCRLNPGEPLVIASHNPGKAREMEDLLRPLGFETLRTAAELALPEPVEDGTTFEANALLKARAAARRAHEVAIADDSGLVVHALGGAPGVLSARWTAGPGEDPGPGRRDFRHAMRRVHEALGEGDDRSAEMVCALAVARPDGHALAFEGRVWGELVWPPRGEEGFGYEPMFAPVGSSRTYGEMPRPEKHAADPRALAFRQLVVALLPGQG